MNLLEMNHVKKSFGGLEVIRDISLHVGEERLFPLSGRPDPANLRCCGALLCWKPWTAAS